ncbi:transmembrane protein 187 [Heptranchias perlo]|uniref:transmembrane protein 187 n=1 Tax=Heptranchias perlo TaxID=212740 RepID=UPI0035595251
MSESKRAFLHVLLLYGLCIAVIATGLLDGVPTELGYEHYAERPVPWLPRCLAMPCNSLVNLGYLAAGAYWLRRRPAAYHKDAFAWMAVGYGPVQWVRLATQAQRPAALDQWVTLPIFAWVPVWAAHLLGDEGGRAGRVALAAEAASLASFALGFELALGCHVLAAVLAGLRAQAGLGDRTSRRHLALAVACCAGFVGLKLLDLRLAGWGLPCPRLTGHFWSKVCDVLQFHHSCRFLQRLELRKRRRRADGERARPDGRPAGDVSAEGEEEEEEKDL